MVVIEIIEGVTIEMQTGVFYAITVNQTGNWEPVVSVRSEEGPGLPDDFWDLDKASLLKPLAKLPKHKNPRDVRHGWRK